MVADLKTNAASGTATVSFTSTTEGTLTLAEPISVYFGLKGVDDIVQDAWTYQVSAETTVNAA